MHEHPQTHIIHTNSLCLQSRHVLFLLMVFHAVFFNVSGSSQSHQGRTLAVQCRRLQRLPSPLLLLDTAAPRVSTASQEGQRHTTERGNCVKGF